MTTTPRPRKTKAKAIDPVVERVWPERNTDNDNTESDIDVSDQQTHRDSA